ncbi:MAG: purine-nucleoside phosphorylase [Chloroflexi bacterium]|nr:purine-nucleoside phosphorylase [Chloroflexota bacterium]
MTETYTRAQFDQAADFIRQRTKHRPAVGLVLGSGLGGLADSVEEADIIPSTDIPHWPRSTVHGHSGRIVIGQVEGQTVLVQQGRVHFYEGHSMATVTFPVRAMRALGIHTLIVTNASGGINENFSAGDLMLITDHLNLIGMAGFSPLRGPNDDTLGPRFPDMKDAYDPGLRANALRAAEEAGIKLQQGVYACLAGPSFETPADLRFLKLIGVDAVGMSTVPEVTVARHGAMKVLGISTISNMVNLSGDKETTHDEVLETGRLVAPRLTAVLRGVLKNLPKG